MGALWLVSLGLGCTLPSPARDGADQPVKFDGEPPDPAWSWGEEIAVDRADASVIGLSTEDARWVLSPVGDVNGDGIDDVIVGSKPDENYYPGHVYVLYGRRDGWALDESLSGTASIASTADDWASGRAVGVGDVNGDGLADVGIAGNGPDHT